MVSAATAFAIPAATITFAVWAVYLGGLAALQDQCDTAAGGSYGLSISSVDVALPCSKAYRYNWFVMSYEFVIIVILFATAISGLLAKGRAAIVGLFAVGLMLFIEVSDQMLNGESIPQYTDGEPRNRIRTATAGAIMTAVMNAVVILVAGFAVEDFGTGHKAAQAADNNPA